MNTQNYNSFLKVDLSKYIGEWIAICRGKIVAKGKDIEKVYEEAKKKYPKERPLITKVPEKETMIF